MKEIKKLTALILSALLLISVFSAFPVFAEDDDLITCGDYKYILLDNGTIELVEYSGKAKALSIPSELDGLAVSGIGFYLFKGLSSLKSVVIPDGVSYINYGAFTGCKNLMSVTIPESVETICFDAFSNCVKLAEINIPDAVKCIERDAFYNTAYYNDNKKWEGGVLYIGNHLIKARFYVDGKYYIKDGTVTIANSAFEGCTDLMGITFPDSLRNIGSSFCECLGIKDITIGKGVKTIASEAFEDCAQLKKIVISASVTDIGENIFKGCHNLTTIIVDSDNTAYCAVESNLYSKDKTIFVQYAPCKKATSFALPDTVTSICPYAFADCKALSSVTIPNSVSDIGWAAFSDCSSLTEAVIPEGVTCVSSETFRNCSALKAVTLPKSVEDIGYYAFSGCSSLTDVNFMGSEARWNYSVWIDEEDNEPILHQAAIHCLGTDDDFELPTDEPVTEPAATQATTTPAATQPATKPVATQAATKPAATESATTVTVKPLNKPAVIPAVKAKLDIKSAAISGIKSKTYTGRAITQTVTVKVGGKNLVKDTDYTLAYTNNINAGAATLTVKGKGNYTGTVKKCFIINKAVNTVTARGTARTVKYATVKKKAIGVTAITVSKPQGAVSFKKTSGNAKITVNAATGKLTVKKGLKKGSYTVKVKVTAKGNANYKSGFKTVSLKITVK